jgi:hypothetical protein
MKNLKTKASMSYLPSPVWCHHCCIRIAPYDSKRVFRGKDYHRDCFAKISQSNGKTDK